MAVMAVTFNSLREVVSCERWIIRPTDDQRSKYSLYLRVLDKTRCLGAKSAWDNFERSIRQIEVYDGQLDSYIGQAWRRIYGKEVRYEE